MIALFRMRRIYQKLYAAICPTSSDGIRLPAKFHMPFSPCENHPKWGFFPRRYCPQQSTKSVKRGSTAIWVRSRNSDLLLHTCIEPGLALRTRP